MSQTIMVPITGQGTISDPNIGSIVPALASAPFDFTDVFLFSHGWWTTADDAMIDYGQFTVGFATAILKAAASGPGKFPKSALDIGLHWPSIVSEDSGSIVNMLQPLSFYNRAKMADDVGEHGGYALIRLILEARKAAGMAPPMFHLIGHSFGCKVVCSALQALAADANLATLVTAASFNVVLLQGAFDNDSFEPKQDYADVIPKIPNLRILITKSGLDIALQQRYAEAQRVVNLFSTPMPATGAQGPSKTTYDSVRGNWITVDKGYTAKPGSVTGKLVVADLTPLHQNDGTVVDNQSGHHSDIYLPEIYNLLTGFLF